MNTILTPSLERTKLKVKSSSEFKRLSWELNQRINEEINDLMSSVSSQFYRTISEAINEHVVPQIQATLRFGQGQEPSRGCEVPGRRPECRSEEAQNLKSRSS